MPNFLVIGVGRAGTTSLYHYLAAHPEIGMSSVKEPNFFEFGEPEQPPPSTILAKNFGVARLDDYQKLFAGMEHFKRRGEASTLNFEARACHRIQSYLPQGKFICSLRHPVDRAYSAFAMWRAAAIEPERDFRTAYTATEQRWHQRYERSLPAYGSQDATWLVQRLTDWLQRFPREQFHIRLYEDLRNDPIRYIHDVYEFLDVDPSFQPDVAHIYNRGMRVRSQRLQRILTQVAPRPNHLRHFPLLAPYARIIRWVRRLNRAPTALLDPAVRRELTVPQCDAILRLQDLIGRDLTHWLPN